MQVDQSKFYIGYVSVIASVSADKGVELIKLYDSAINEHRFSVYLAELSRVNDRQPFFIFLDNLAVHKTTLVKRVCEKLKIVPIFNVPYQPDLNPIESCFSQVKRYYGNQRLQRIVNNLPFERNQVIKEAFDQIQPTHVRNYIKKSEEALDSLNF